MPWAWQGWLPSTHEGEAEEEACCVAHACHQKKASYLSSIECRYQQIICLVSDFCRAFLHLHLYQRALASPTLRARRCSGGRPLQRSGYHSVISCPLLRTHTTQHEKRAHTQIHLHPCRGGCRSACCARCIRHNRGSCVCNACAYTNRGRPAPGLACCACGCARPVRGGPAPAARQRAAVVWGPAQVRGGTTTPGFP